MHEHGVIAVARRIGSAVGPLGWIEALLYLALTPLLVAVAWVRSMWAARALLEGRWSHFQGFHPLNVGNLVTNRPGPRPCTPSGIMEMLRRYDIPVAGKNAVVVGRSDIVGKPMALMLLHQHATVTICHSKTADLPGECRRADILVAAIGKAGLIRGNFIKPGATVIDVGMNRLNTPAEVGAVFGDNAAKRAEFEKKGSLLVGDVHPLEVDQAGAVTPVPGGVGPLTIAMLMANTVAAAEAHTARS